MVPEETLERAAVDDVSPRYLRKQKASSGKRRRPSPAAKPRGSGRLLVLLIVLGAGAAVGSALYLFLDSPVVRLHPGGVRISGEHYVGKQQLKSVFAADIGKSIVLVPLDRRLREIEEIPWVKQAEVERVLPNRIDVRIVERDPVAFLSTDTGMKLIDAEGVILNRPPGTNFSLPVVTGIGKRTPLSERASRMSLFADFLKQIGTVRPNAASAVSEANLASPDDIEVTLAGKSLLSGQGPVVVHFGNGDFVQRYREFLEDFHAWKVRAGNVAEVDLRFNGQALVTPGSVMANGGENP